MSGNVRIPFIIALASFLVACAQTGPHTPHETEGIPIFDTHIHYNKSAQIEFSTEEIIELFEMEGIARALVSSTPNTGTRVLHRKNPNRIVQNLRPYRSWWDRNTQWYRNHSVLSYLIEELERNEYRGIGEFHVSRKEHVVTPQVRSMTQLAVNQDIVLHIHSGAGPVRALFELEPKLKILWAHAGRYESLEVVAKLLDQYPQLWTEVSLRASDIYSNGRLNSEWRDLFLRHPDRFMVGSDTHSNSRWKKYHELVQEHRRWLTLLPLQIREAIAYGNAQRLFGDGE